MTERQIELTWVCSTCQGQNLGRHMACQRCGNPKDASEEYVMPVDPAQVASVTDPKLLAMATAGEHWRCNYCGSHQRALDGGCAVCGAGRRAGANADRPSSLAFRAQRIANKGVPKVFVLLIVAAGFLGLAIIVTIALTSRRRHPSLADDSPSPVVVAADRTQGDFDVEVASVAWRRTIAVDTWQLVPHDGFEGEIPDGAIDVKATGRKIHHYEDVFDHDETTYEDVEVPDGTTTETYTERVQCGQTCTTTPRICRPMCTTTPRTCRQSCKNNKNGFATCTTDCSGGTTSCRDDCTGGGSTCAPKYCDERRTRQIPKTKRERRPKIVKKYRSEPRYAIGATYKTWEWKPLATFDAHGDDVFMQWPETAPDAGPGALVEDGGAPKAGDKREARTERVRVTFKRDDGITHEYRPASDAELAKLRPGTKHKIHVDGGGGVDRVRLID